MHKFFGTVDSHCNVPLDILMMHTDIGNPVSAVVARAALCIGIVGFDSQVRKHLVLVNNLSINPAQEKSG